MCLIPPQTPALVGLATGYAETGAGAAVFVGWVLLLLAGIFALLEFKLRPQAGGIAAGASLVLTFLLGIACTLVLNCVRDQSDDPDVLAIEQMLQVHGQGLLIGGIVTAVAAVGGLFRKGKKLTPLRGVEWAVVLGIIVVTSSFIIVFANIF
jgi:hypothetical protein